MATAKKPAARKYTRAQSTAANKAAVAKAHAKPVKAKIKTGTSSSTPVAKKATKGGDYPVYKKTSAKAESFREAFSDARKEGKKVFTWNGRKYNTKVK